MYSLLMNERMAAAFLPALLYFAAVWFGINAYATRYDLLPISGSDQPRGRDVLITSLFFAVPFAVLMERMELVPRERRDAFVDHLTGLTRGGSAGD